MFTKKRCLESVLNRLYANQKYILVTFVNVFHRPCFLKELKCLQMCVTTMTVKMAECVYLRPLRNTTVTVPSSTQACYVKYVRIRVKCNQQHILTGNTYLLIKRYNVIIKRYNVNQFFLHILSNNYFCNILIADVSNNVRK